MKSLQEYLNESVVLEEFEKINEDVTSNTSQKNMSLTYTEFCKQQRGSLWGEWRGSRSEYPQTMPDPCGGNSMREWLIRIEDISKYMNPEAAEVFLNTINSSYFKKYSEYFVFYVSDGSGLIKVRRMGLLSKIPIKGPRAFDRDASYPILHTDYVNDFAYWFRDNIKNCVQYIKKHCE